MKLLWNKQQTTTATTTAVGLSSEKIAAEYLSQHGLLLKTQNFHSRYGEIDLVMLEKDTLIFVEVKYRKSSHFGGAISAISYKKIQKIKLCVKFFLQKHGLNEYNTPCRFDVIALQGDLTNPQITWLKNAF